MLDQVLGLVPAADGGPQPVDADQPLRQPRRLTSGSSSSWNHMDSSDWLPGQALIASTASSASAHSSSLVR
jgi:hypothetical protein